MSVPVCGTGQVLRRWRSASTDVLGLESGGLTDSVGDGTEVTCPTEGVLPLALKTLKDLHRDDRSPETVPTGTI